MFGEKKLTFLFLLIFSFSYSQKILWNEKVKLNWSNFKSKENTKFSKDPTVVSYSACGIRYLVAKGTQTGNIKVKIDATFDENASWKDASQTKSLSINHEQGHFDIAEIFARKLRLEFVKNVKTAKDFEIKFKVIYQILYQQFIDYQNEYDKITSRGTVYEKQKEFEEKIKKELKSLEAYKN